MLEGSTPLFYTQKNPSVLMLRWETKGNSHVQYMLRSGFSCNIWRIAVYLATSVFSRPCGRLGVEGKMILKWRWTKWFGVDDNVSYFLKRVYTVEFHRRQEILKMRLAVRIWRETQLFDSNNFLVIKNYAEVYSYGRSGPVRHVKELINIAGFLLSRKTGVTNLWFCVALQFISNT
jgi:hypothetical protein